MTRRASVVILGGGLSGMAAAHRLAERGMAVTLVERSEELGGLAGSHEVDGRSYPLGYHHILSRDETLLRTLGEIGALGRVRWRKVRLLFHVDGRFHDLGSPMGFLRFPMAVSDKARFVTLMVRCFRKSDWSDWADRTASDLVDEWGSPGAREAIFERLSQLRFELPCRDLGAAWLGARLYHREGSSALGYIPDANWTRVLCGGVEQLVAERGVSIRRSTALVRLHARGDRVTEAETTEGERLQGDTFVSTVPTEVFRQLCPEDSTPELRGVRYTALVSLVCATPTPPTPAAYWLNVAAPDHAACGIFQLDQLNSSIGPPNEACINFVTHLRDRGRPFFRLGDDEILERYESDFRRIYGARLEPKWVRVSRIPMYAPIPSPGYRNPPIRSRHFRNLFFAGNYRTFPSIMSTGTAIGSGLETAGEILGDRDAAD